MIRTAIITAVAAASVASGAVAAEVVTTKGFTQQQAAQHLVRMGYTGVSELEKDNDGRWVGYAYKNGSRVPVAVAQPHPTGQPVTQ